MDQAGFLAALPYLLMACIVQSAGFLADLARTRGRLTTTQVRYFLDETTMLIFSKKKMTIFKKKTLKWIKKMPNFRKKILK